MADPCVDGAWENGNIQLGKVEASDSGREKMGARVEMLLEVGEETRKRISASLRLQHDPQLRG